MVATGTFNPLATLLAPHTICTVVASPESTGVILKRSASGCFSQVSTCPTTMPSKPPFTDWYFSTTSTSKPKSDRIAAVSSDFKSILMNCFNQLYEIFICNQVYFKECKYNQCSP